MRKKLTNGNFFLQLIKKCWKNQKKKGHRTSVLMYKSGPAAHLTQKDELPARLPSHHKNQKSKGLGCVVFFCYVLK